jgi:hypothetical protein
MSKKLGWLLVAFALIVPLVMTACGGDKKDEAKAADLKQEFTSTSGITVQYPDGWVAQDGDAGVEIANKAEFLTMTGASEVPSGGVALVIMPPFEPTAMGLAADATLKDVTDMVAQGMAGEGDGATASDAQDVKVGGKDAVRVNIADSTTNSEGFFIGYKVDDTHVLIAVMATHAGELSKNEATVLKILDSVTYTAPAQ